MSFAKPQYENMLVKIEMSSQQSSYDQLQGSFKQSEGRLQLFEGSLAQFERNQRSIVNQLQESRVQGFMDSRIQDSRIFADSHDGMPIVDYMQEDE